MPCVEESVCCHEWWASLCPNIFIGCVCGAIWPERRIIIFNAKYYGEPCPALRPKMDIDTKWTQKKCVFCFFLEIKTTGAEEEEKKEKRKGGKEETGGQTRFVNTCTWRLPHLLQMLERIKSFLLRLVCVCVCVCPSQKWWLLSGGRRKIDKP